MGQKERPRGRIVIDPKIHFGKPYVAGTRIPVEDVLELIQEGISFKEIVNKYYPDLTIEDVKACARYATELVRAEEIHVEALNALPGRSGRLLDNGGMTAEGGP